MERMVTTRIRRPSALPKRTASGIVVRPWGAYQTLARQSGWLVKRLVVQPGQRLSLQYHHHRAEYWVVVQGLGIAQIGIQRQLMKLGETFHIPVGTWHRIENIHASERLEILEIQIGDTLVETDIVRVGDDYGRASV